MDPSMREELSCPICLQLFLDPVVLPCGHNYCQVCILQTINSSDKKLQCPECRMEFEGAQSLQKNFKLGSIINGFLASTSKSDVSPVTQQIQHASKSDAVPVTQEIKRASKADATLVNLQLKRENSCIRSADRALQTGKECEIHRSPLVYFCSTDMTLLCSKCFMEGRHQDHDLLTFSVAEGEMRRALEVRSKVVGNRLQMTDFLVERVKEERGLSETIGDKLVNKAATTVEVMAELVNGYRDRLHKLLEDEQTQRRNIWQSGVGTLEEQQQLLVDALQSANEALSLTDSCSFINRFLLIEEKLRKAATVTIACNIPSKAPLNTKQMQESLRTEAFRAEMSRLAEFLCILFNPLQLTFNESSAHPHVQLSNDLRTAKYSDIKQPYPEHKERFTSAPQVMCNEGFSNGEHVWVVEVGPESMWSLGVCYKTIPRRGDHSRLGHNSMSWRLQWKSGKLTVCKSSSNVVLREMKIQPLKIEVALDYEGGTLMFHNIKGQREHLYTFKVAFKETVYPAFSIHSNTPQSWITLQCGL
ncbi:E3 ubiquitin/ISG15 ligase TRIM25-like [Corythoichthys intestinalis]|uniref:E3 ubiquitin/ISG15 ligase TRIM25-like n=1 Tax=Corythoichthys intestinalis TaxID=161448 RepID=UPI0025A5F3F7|nr:E3 ubiquitin/ISG15 ligase TRIM25-like [Corythoichthys intestinalis]XP_061802169.1 E3 ubiquitin/ISG15 ligase TRIM25-like [Nerophis lumbriciformis]